MKCPTESPSIFRTRTERHGKARPLFWVTRARMGGLVAALSAVTTVACGGGAGEGGTAQNDGRPEATSGSSSTDGAGGAGAAGAAATATEPGVRFGAAAAYLGDTGRMMLFGGCSSPTWCTPLSGTWTRDGAGWTGEEAPGAPSARFHHAMTYDAARSEVVLFGGNSDPMGASVYVTNVRAGLDETWTYDGWTWIKKTLALAPSGRAGSKMVYDAEHKVVVLFGGAGDGIYLSDTWLWDGMDWTNPKPVTSPSPRAHHMMAYDAVRKNVVLFGGYAESRAGRPAGDGALGDTWLWDGTTWTEQTPPAAPTPRTSASMTFDGESAILFGGWQATGSFTPLAETWAWDGATWALETPPDAPSARYLSTLAYDPSRSVVSLYGGLNEGAAPNGPAPPSPSSGVSSDLWDWDRTGWTLRR